MVQKIINEKVEGCSHKIIVTDNETGELVCANCGLVESNRIVDTKQEWRSFFMNNEKEDQSRVGPAASLAIHDKGLSTVIGAANRDASGRSFSLHMKHDIKRWRVWNSRIFPNETSHRGLVHAFNELRVLKDKLALPDAVVERSAYIYRKAKAKNLIQGRRNKTLMAASVYTACRQSSVIRTLNDISQAADISKKEIATCYRLLHKELDFVVPIVDSVDCISRIASKIGIPEKINRHAIEIIRQAEQIEYSAGKEPMGLAAAALYLACRKLNRPYSQSKIAESANVTTVTIRNLSQGLKKALDI